MAQLRDKETSEILAEGTPFEVAIAGRKIGLDEVIFDDVGLGFDPEAVIDAHEQEIEGLTRAAKEEEEKQAREDTARRARELQAEAAGAEGNLAAGAQKALDEARALLEG